MATTKLVTVKLTTSEIASLIRLCRAEHEAKGARKGNGEFRATLRAQWALSDALDRAAAV